MPKLITFGDELIRINPSRTYSLYLDICDTGALSLKEFYQTWKPPQLYEFEGSYFYFDKVLPGGIKLAIDIGHGRNIEENYWVKVFLRKNDKEEMSVWFERERKFFTENPLSGFSLKETIKDGILKDARMVSDEPLTRQQCISILKELLIREWK